MGLPIRVGTYPIDTAHSQLGFSLMHLGISAIRGTFDEYSGELNVGDDLDSTSVTIDADMASINSGNPLRDKNVQVAEYLDVANHPRMSFRSTSIAEAPDIISDEIDLLLDVRFVRPASTEAST